MILLIIGHTEIVSIEIRYFAHSMFMGIVTLLLPPFLSDWKLTIIIIIFDSNSLPNIDFSSRIDHIDDPEEYFSAFEQLESNPLYLALALFTVKRGCSWKIIILLIFNVIDFQMLKRSWRNWEVMSLQTQCSIISAQQLISVVLDF